MFKIVSFEGVLLKQDSKGRRNKSSSGSLTLICDERLITTENFLVEVNMTGRSGGDLEYQLILKEMVLKVY